MQNKQEKSRTVYAIKNIIFNFAYQIINTVVNIIVPPLIIGYFGSAINGLISTIKQILSYIQLVGAGISESTVVSFYKPLGEGDNKKTSAIYNAVGKTFNRAGLLFTLCSMLVAIIYPFFLKEELDYFFVFAIVLVLSISGISEFFLIGKYRSLLIADQKLYVVNLAQIFGAVISTSITIILIKLGFNIIFVQTATVMTYVLRTFVLTFYIKRKYKYLNRSEAPDYSATSKRKAATIHQVASLIIFGSQTLFIANFCGLAEASVYSVYNLVFSGIGMVLSTVSSAMLSGMGNLIAGEDNEKVKSIYNIYELLYYMFTFTIFITTLVMIKPFLYLYTSGITDAEYIRSELIILFTLMGIINCMRTPGATMINAKGHYDETKNRALIEMAICLVGEFCLVWRFGVAGVLVGTILAYLYRMFDVVIYSNNKVLCQSAARTIKRIAIFTLLIAVFGYGFFKTDIVASNYLVWALYSVLVVAVAFLAVLLVGFIFDRSSLLTSIRYIINFLKGLKKNAK